MRFIFVMVVIGAVSLANMGRGMFVQARADREQARKVVRDLDIVQREVVLVEQYSDTGPQQLGAFYTACFNDIRVIVQFNQVRVTVGVDDAGEGLDISQKFVGSRYAGVKEITLSASFETGDVWRGIKILRDLEVLQVSRPLIIKEVGLSAGTLKVVMQLFGI